MEQIPPDNRPVYKLTESGIGSAIEVHSIPGPGLLESTCEECFAAEFVLRGIPFERRKSTPRICKGRFLKSELRVDFIVGQSVRAERKGVETLFPVHQAQLVTNLKLSEREIGLRINFNGPALKTGVKRMFNPQYQISEYHCYELIKSSVSPCLCGEKGKK